MWIKIVAILKLVIFVGLFTATWIYIGPVYAIVVLFSGLLSIVTTLIGSVLTCFA